MNDYWRQFFEGNTVGKYQIQEFLGAGGFALVFRAEHSETGHEVALKLLPPSASQSQASEFRNEGVLLGILNASSSVVRLFESDEADCSVPVANGSSMPVRVPYLALELGFGCLEELVLNRETLAWRDRLSLWRGVVKGVHQMHLHKVAHRDLKSDNCLLFMRSKNTVESKVTDLGRSRHWAGPRLHAIELYTHPLGDFRFAPPELLLGLGSDSPECHALADLYGLGSVLFELVTGQAITSIALGDGFSAMQEFAKLQAAGQTLPPNALMDDYERAFQLFASSVPPSIRDKATPLVRQLCCPVPSNRVPKTTNKKMDRVVDPGLDWLLRRVDIVRNSLVEVESASLVAAGAS